MEDDLLYDEPPLSPPEAALPSPEAELLSPGGNLATFASSAETRRKSFQDMMASHDEGYSSFHSSTERSVV